jgi:hypothetical protein
MGVLAPSRARAMFLKRAATSEANLVAEIEAREYRASDELEQAKLILRQRGWKVFNHSLISPFSQLIVVGNTPITKAEVIARAARIREERKAWDGS